MKNGKKDVFPFFKDIFKLFKHFTNPDFPLKNPELLRLLISAIFHIITFRPFSNGYLLAGSI
jgi:hypothetical protein